MKTIIHAAVLTIVCIVNLQAQDSTRVLAPIAKGFQREFSGATAVQWEQTGPLYSARFKYNNGYWVAFFDKDGALIASGRKIADVSQLPVAVQRGIAQEQQKQERKYGSFAVGAPYELIEQNGITRYFVPIENSHIAMMVTSDTHGATIIRNKKVKSDRTEPATDLLAATVKH